MISMAPSDLTTVPSLLSDNPVYHQRSHFGNTDEGSAEVAGVVEFSGEGDPAQEGKREEGPMGAGPLQEGQG